MVGVNKEEQFSGGLPEIISYFFSRLINLTEVRHRHGLILLLEEGNVRVVGVIGCKRRG